MASLLALSLVVPAFGAQADSRSMSAPIGGNDIGWMTSASIGSGGEISAADGLTLLGAGGTNDDAMRLTVGAAMDAGGGRLLRNGQAYGGGMNLSA
jgi:hypothetical protein